jgi:hypothetical protein
MNTARLFRIFGSVALLFIVFISTGCSHHGHSSTPTYNISGTVSGVIQQGVIITLTGASSEITTTDASGNYSFTNLQNGSYTVAPTHTGHVFTPASQVITINGTNQTAINFTSAISAEDITYSISGTVAVSGGAPLPGVTMTLSGTNTATVTTDASGNFTFTATNAVDAKAPQRFYILQTQ